MNFRKLASLTAIAVFSASAISISIAADDAPVLALSGSAVGGEKARLVRADSIYQIDFMPSSTPVAGVNFDVVIESAFSKRGEGGVTITDCAGSVSGSHIARCEMVAPNRLRVLVFSAPVKELPAATLVSFSIKGQAKDVRIDSASAAVSDLNGGMIRAEIL